MFSELMLLRNNAYSLYFFVSSFYNVYTNGGRTMNVILRKTGNSTVITIPNKIKETLGAEIGEEIEFVTSGNNVIIRKAEPKFDFDKELEKAMNQYDELLKELVDR